MKKKDILEKLEKLHLFFHHVAMDYTGELSKEYSLSHGNCQLMTQNDFIVAEGVSAFILTHITGILSDSPIPNLGKIENVCECGHKEWEEHKSSFGPLTAQECNVKGCKCKKFRPKQKECKR